MVYRFEMEDHKILLGVLADHVRKGLIDLFDAITISCSIGVSITQFIAEQNKNLP
jgi:hypothetical protein